MRKGNTFAPLFVMSIAACILIFTPVGRSLLSSLGYTLQAKLSSSYTSTIQSSVQTSGCSYEHLIRQDATAAGIPEQYFLRQIIHESSCDPTAVGRDGEEGIAQFLPGTARGLGLSNPFDPGAALWTAAHLMARYQEQFGGDYAKALAAYNAGSGTVHASERCGVLWLTCLSEDIRSTGTRDYVNTILYGS